MEMEAIVRRLGRLSGKQPIGLDEFGGISMSKLLPDFARLNAAGKLFAFDTHAGTAKAPVVAAPTTSPEWGLYNDSENETLVLIQVGCTLKSGTAGLGLALMGTSAKGKQTAVAADYTGAIKGCLDGTKKDASFYITNNPTLVGGTPPWVVLETTKVNTVATDSVGDGLVAQPNGLFIAPPGGMVAFEVVGETGTSALFSVSGIVAMLELDRY